MLNANFLTYADESEQTNCTNDENMTDFEFSTLATYSLKFTDSDAKRSSSRTLRSDNTSSGKTSQQIKKKFGRILWKDRPTLVSTFRPL